jgi:hypothetical protein
MDLGDAPQELWISFHLIHLKHGNKYNTEQHYQIDELYRRETKNVWREGWRYWDQNPDIPGHYRRCWNEAPMWISGQTIPVALREQEHANQEKNQYTLQASTRW